MTNRRDIVDGTNMDVWTKKYGLIYTCNAGWLDLGHLNPESSRPEIGAANLWRQVASESGTILDPRCAPPPPLGGLFGAIQYALTRPEVCDRDPRYHFPDGQRGYLVHYRQDSASVPGKPGREGRYIIKHGLTIEQKKSVALAIFIEISLRFERLQLFAEKLGIAKSGFSQEDLVSDLIGFYIGIGEVSKLEAIRACHPVSAAAAYAIWDREGSVADHKNVSFSPQFAHQTGLDTTHGCQDECARQPRRLPKIFTRIRPMQKGMHFRDLLPA